MRGSINPVKVSFNYGKLANKKQIIVIITHELIAALSEGATLTLPQGLIRLFDNSSFPRC